MRDGEITSSILGFREFLNLSWPVGKRLLASSSEGIVGDWLQANWEILVEAPWRERMSGGFLEPYGDGADCNGASSRVWLPDAVPTHRIICTHKKIDQFHDVLTNETVSHSKLNFDKLVNWGGGLYEEEPPFDYLLTEIESSIVVFSIKDVRFCVEPI